MFFFLAFFSPFFSESKKDWQTILRELFDSINPVTNIINRKWHYGKLHPESPHRPQHISKTYRFLITHTHTHTKTTLCMLDLFFLLLIFLLFLLFITMYRGEIVENLRVIPMFKTLSHILLDFWCAFHNCECWPKTNFMYSIKVLSSSVSNKMSIVVKRTNVRNTSIWSQFIRTMITNLPRTLSSKMIRSCLLAVFFSVCLFYCICCFVLLVIYCFVNQCWHWPSYEFRIKLIRSYLHGRTH